MASMADFPHLLHLLKLKVKKNTMEKATERPMKTGVVAAGAESSTVGALFGRTETSGPGMSYGEAVWIGKDDTP